MTRRNNHLRFSRTPVLIRLFIVVVIVVALVAPMNFVLMSPGPASPLFPKILSIKDPAMRSYPVNGNLYLLTIYVTNPESYVFGAEVLGCWVKGDCVAVPRSVMYRDGTTDEKAISEGSTEMSDSQNTAVVAAKKYIQKKYPDINLAALKDSSVKISLSNTGGPSGGLVFTLGLIDLLTPIDILQGRKIAGTGTISDNGAIGPIGGVTEKIAGARKAGAEILFISTTNCSELPAKVEGLSVIAISSIGQAVDYLLRGSSVLDSAGIHGCASVGA